MTTEQPCLVTTPSSSGAKSEPTASSKPTRFDAIVMAGGRASRLGGVDKAAILLQGSPLVDRCIEAARGFGAARIIVAGPAGAGAGADVQVREDPPFSGPLAALDAGLREAQSPVVMVLACDLISPSEVVEQLTHSLSNWPHDVDGILLEDEYGYPQWLASSFRADTLRAALAQYRAETGTLENASLRAVFLKLRLQKVVARPGSTEDIDTPEQLAHAREREKLRHHEHTNPHSPRSTGRLACQGL